MRIPHSAFPNVAAVLAAFCLVLSMARAAEALPKAPDRYFNDYASVTRPATQQELNRRLEQFERDQSCQIIVAIFPSLPQGAALEDFTYRTATAWKVGQAKLNNGAVLFLFVSDRKMRIEVGYGLEGKIPDAIAKRITSEQIKPHLQRGDYDAALSAGVTALMSAARGEYKGSGRTASDSRGNPTAMMILIAILLIGFMGALGGLTRRARGSVYGRRGHSSWAGMPTVWGSGGGWGGGSGGGGWGGGGGGFSGGGGSFGGGGASDSW